MATASTSSASARSTGARCRTTRSSRATRRAEADGSSSRARSSEALDPAASRTIDIEDFVSLGEIDPVYHERTYWAVPDRGAGRAYALLRTAMQKAGRVGIARFVMRERQHLCAVRPLEKVPPVSTMQYADEIVEAPVEEVSGRSATARELDVALQLVDALTVPFQPDKHQDEYRQRVLDLIARKAKGERIIVPEEAERPAPVQDLFQALRESLATARPEHEPRAHGRTRAAGRRASARNGTSRRARRAA